MPRPPSLKVRCMFHDQQTKVVDVGLEDFMDWTGIISSELVEEEISSLAARFSARMHKRATGSKSETTPRSDGKRLKQSSLNEDA